MAGKSPRDRPHTFVRDKFCQLYRPVHYASGTWFKFNGVAYETVPDYLVKQQVQDIIDADRALKIQPTFANLRSITELIKIKIAIPDRAMDSNHNLLTFSDCTLEIDTRQRRMHSHKDLLTSAFSFPYDSAVRSDVWEMFLDKVVPDDCRDFIQEFAGYCLTTDMAHETAVWLYGPAGCGKSTLIEGIRAALGQRVVSFGIHNLEDRFGLAHLQGKTLAISTETPASVRQIQLLSLLISGEGVTVEKKYQDGYEFFNHAKFLWAMNDVPKGDNFKGLDRRVVILKFPPLLESERDENVKRPIQLSGQAVLNWMLEGLDRLHARGHFERPSESAHVLSLVSASDVEVEM